MNPLRGILAFVVLQQFLIKATDEFRLRPKHFKVESVVSCKPPSNHRGKLERLNVTQPVKYHFYLDADLRFFVDITDPIQFHMTYSTCTLDNDGSKCDAHETTKIDNVCDRLRDKNAVWTPLVKMIKPKLACPIKKGLYTIRNGTLDLSAFSLLPIDGYRYITSLSLYELPKNDAPPVQLLCLDSDVIVTAQSNSRPRHNG